MNYYNGNITPEDADVIMVFGSNPEGRHGKGAAKVAVEQFGAKYGQGEGLQGNAYALPTKDLRVKENASLRSITPDTIVESIKKLYQTARENPEKTFRIAYRNTDEASLNGYTGHEMMAMFLAASSDIPSNIEVSSEWFFTGLFDNRYIDFERDEYSLKDLKVSQKIIAASKAASIIARDGSGSSALSRPMTLTQARQTLGASFVKAFQNGQREGLLHEGDFLHAIFIEPRSESMTLRSFSSIKEWETAFDATIPQIKEALDGRKEALRKALESETELSRSLKALFPQNIDTLTLDSSRSIERNGRQYTLEAYKYQDRTFCRLVNPDTGKVVSMEDMPDENSISAEKENFGYTVNFYEDIDGLHPQSVKRTTFSPGYGSEYESSEIIFDVQGRIDWDSSLKDDDSDYPLTPEMLEQDIAAAALNTYINANRTFVAQMNYDELESMLPGVDIEKHLVRVDDKPIDNLCDCLVDMSPDDGVLKIYPRTEGRYFLTTSKDDNFITSAEDYKSPGLENNNIRRVTPEAMKQQFLFTRFGYNAWSASLSEHEQIFVLRESFKTFYPDTGFNLDESRLEESGYRNEAFNHIYNQDGGQAMIGRFEKAKLVDLVLDNDMAVIAGKETPDLDTGKLTAIRDYIISTPKKDIPMDHLVEADEVLSHFALLYIQGEEVKAEEFDRFSARLDSLVRSIPDIEKPQVVFHRGERDILKMEVDHLVFGSRIFDAHSFKEVYKSDSADRRLILGEAKLQKGEAVKVLHHDRYFIVDRNRDILSLTSGNIMKWGEENGDRRDILLAADGLFRKMDEKKTAEAAKLEQRKAAQKAVDNLSDIQRENLNEYINDLAIELTVGGDRFTPTEFISLVMNKGLTEEMIPAFKEAVMTRCEQIHPGESREFVEGLFDRAYFNPSNIRTSKVEQMLIDKGVEFNVYTCVYEVCNGIYSLHYTEGDGKVYERLYDSNGESILEGRIHTNPDTSTKIRSDHHSGLLTFPVERTVDGKAVMFNVEMDQTSGKVIREEPAEAPVKERQAAVSPVQDSPFTKIETKPEKIKVNMMHTSQEASSASVLEEIKAAPKKKETFGIRGRNDEMVILPCVDTKSRKVPHSYTIELAKNNVEAVKGKVGGIDVDRLLADKDYESVLKLAYGGQTNPLKGVYSIRKEAVIEGDEIKAVDRKVFNPSTEYTSVLMECSKSTCRAQLIPVMTKDIEIDGRMQTVVDFNYMSQGDNIYTCNEKNPPSEATKLSERQADALRMVGRADELVTQTWKVGAKLEEKQITFGVEAAKFNYSVPVTYNEQRVANAVESLYSVTNENGAPVKDSRKDKPTYACMDYNDKGAYVKVADVEIEERLVDTLRANKDIEIIALKYARGKDRKILQDENGKPLLKEFKTHIGYRFDTDRIGVVNHYYERRRDITQDRDRAQQQTRDLSQQPTHGQR